MRPEDAEPLAVGGGRADGIAAGAVGVIVVAGRAMRRADMPEGRLDVRTADACQAFASGASDGQDGKALAGVAAEGLNMQTGDRLDDGPAGASRWPSSTRWSARDRALSRAQAANAANSAPWSIRPFWKASKPKRRLRSVSTGDMTWVSRKHGGARGRLDADDGVLLRAMSRISRIIARPLVLCIRDSSDRASGPPARRPARLLPLRIGPPFLRRSRTRERTGSEAYWSLSV